MGSKKKNSAKHQGGKGGGEPNGGHATHTSQHNSGSNSHSSSPKGQGRSSSSSPKSGKENSASAPASSTHRNASVSSSSSSSSSLPESRLPWRLLLLVSIVAGGAAILCVNEPAKSIIEEAYLTHAQPHILSVAQALGLLQPDTEQPPTVTSTTPPPTVKKPSREEKPASDSKPTSPPPSTPSPSSAETPQTKEPEKPKPEPEAVQNHEKKSSSSISSSSSEDNEEKETERGVEREDRQEEKEKEDREKRKERKEEKEEEKKASKVRVTSSEEAAAAAKSHDGKSSAETRTPHTATTKTATADAPSVSESQQTPPPTQPVVEEIRVKTTPKTAQEGRPQNPQDSTTATQEKSEQTASAGPTESLPEAAGESSEESAYAKANITNAYDFKIRDKLDEAEELLAKGGYEEAVLKRFENLLSKHPKSPRALLGRADSLDKLAYKKRSNEVLEQSILGYERLVYHGEDVTPALMKMAGRKLAEKQQFRGWSGKAVKTLAYLSQLYPEDLQLQRERGLSHLMSGQIDQAQEVFEAILKTHPDDGYSLVHLGFLMKTSRHDYEGGITLLQKGIDGGDPGTQDSRFYFQLGDAYYRTGQHEKSRQVYEEGANKGLFLSADQRSIYNVKRLQSRPWWTKEQTGYQQYMQLLEDNWQMIRDEAVKQLDNSTGLFKPEAESLREKGDWKQLTMYQQGRKNSKVCALVPKTCELIDQIPDAKGCKRGQVKFSVIHPGTHVWAHCGPTNCRIRSHLGLIVPQGIRIRVVNETRTWEEGKFLVFDDSFEHEVWHEGDSFRMVLIVDFWHPDLTAQEKMSLVPI